MIDAPLFIANTETTLRSIAFATKVVRTIDRKHKEALLSLDRNKFGSNFEYETMSVFAAIMRLVSHDAPALIKKHYNEITEIISDKIEHTVMEARSKIATTVFPDLSAQQVSLIVANQQIPQKIYNALKRGGSSPRQIASMIAIMGNPAERRRLLDDYFRRLRNAAYTSVRTGMASMAGQVNREVYDSIPADVIGFQVLGILDNRIRPAHRARHGTIYYKVPGVDRPGFEQMPNPPLEADGSYAFNCRCSLIPVFKGDDTKARDIRGRIIPNAKVFSVWFDRQTQAAKIAIVGKKRYMAAVARKGGGSPNWIEFLDSRTGILMTDKEIENETRTKRKNRIARLYSKISMNS